MPFVKGRDDHRLSGLSLAMLTATALAKDLGVNRRTVDRMLACTISTTIDTLQAVSQRLLVEPWQLLLRSETQSALRKVFSTPVPDDRLGPAWTRPDRRKPLIQGSVSAKVTKPKIKTQR